MFIKIFKIIIIAFVFVLLRTGHADAFSITPTKAIITVNAGATDEYKIWIKNEEKNSKNFNLKITCFEQDNAGRPVFGSNKSEAEKWIKFNQYNLLLNTGESKSIDVAIAVPVGAKPGSYYIAVVVETAVASSSQTSATNLSGQVASLLFLQVGGLVNESIKIIKWEPKKDLITGNSWNFYLNLANNGDIETPMIGSLKINNWRGQNIIEEKINLGNQLLANSVRFLYPEMKLDSKNIYLPGLYQAQINIKYGKTGQTIAKMTHIWYFPRYSMWLGGFSALFFIFILFFIFKKLRKSNLSS
jgi:hypothetical protein